MPDDRSPELHPDLTDDEVEERLETGIQLFNAGEHFESHEYFEEVWRSSNPEPRDLFQGLVQVAAAFHIWRERGTAEAAGRVMDRGVRHLEAVAPDAMGIDLESLLDALDPWLRWFTKPAGEEPPLPRIRRNSLQDEPDDDSIVERTAPCPWCGEPLSWSIDPSGGREQDYVEDCAVCCRPCRIEVSFRDGLEIEVIQD